MSSHGSCVVTIVFNQVLVSEENRNNLLPKFRRCCLQVFFRIDIQRKLQNSQENTYDGFLLKGYLRYKTIFYNEIALDV